MKKILLVTCGEENEFASMVENLKNSDFEVVSLNLFDDPKLKKFQKKVEEITENIKNNVDMKKRKKMRSRYRHKYGKYTKRAVNLFKSIKPDLIFNTNYFVTFASMEYNQKFDKGVRVVTYNPYEKVHTYWDNRPHVFVVNNHDAYLHAIGKKKFLPYLVYEIKPEEKEQELSKIITQVLSTEPVTQFRTLLENHLYELAQQGQFDAITNPINLLTVADFDYNEIKHFSFFEKVFKWIIKATIFIFGPILNFFTFNVRVKGRKNLKGLKSAISIGNHVHQLDSLWLYTAFKHKNFYLTGASFQWKRGFKGELFKCANFLPLPATLSQNREFVKLISELLKKGSIINFNAEQTMWLRYKQSRPLKRGAFVYAYENNVPILPVFHMFRKTIFKTHRFTTTHICKPIYPDFSLPKVEAIRKMQAEAQKVYDDLVIDFYKYDKETYEMNKINKPVKKKQKSAKKAKI